MNIDIFKDFDFSNFDKSWAELDQDQQCLALDSISELTPPQAVNPIIAGLSSYHYLLRNKAREALKTIQLKMIEALENKNNKTQYIKAINESDCFCSRIFLQIKKNIPISELNYYFQALIQSKGRGPFYAWKICYSGLISTQSFKILMPSLSDGEKLVLTDQYLKSSPQVRREWALEFKKILKKIKKKREIFIFLSDLFDNNKDVDPFLFTIPILRDQNNILLDSLNSAKPLERVMILKAASLIYDRLDTDLLIDCLNNKKEPDIRLVALNIIEFSPIDTYSHPLLTNCLLNIFKSGDQNEGFMAFKALAITRTIPLFKLFVQLIKLRKDILLSVLDEISSFSRISFLVIQDVAKNKKEYLKHNALVFKALILGLVRKRPDRIIKILKKFETSSDDFIRTQVLAFKDLINGLLEKEKQDIEKEIKSLIQRINNAQTNNAGIIKGLFLTSTEKKLKDLKESKFPKEFDFEQEIIQSIDLSGLKLLNYIIYFNGSIIKDSIFSKVIIENSFFQSAIIYNVDFTSVEFNSVCFDNAIFIDVNASKARFVNCSFCNCSIYNSNFNDSDCTSSFFTGSRIVKTSFDRSNLTGTSFVASTLTFTTFTDSILSLSDFTCITARYSKFDDFADNTMITGQADFNSKAFKIKLENIPYFHKDIILRLEMLIFVEFLYYGEKIFLKKNKLSKLIAFDIYKKKQGDLFELIPLLLHENILFPGGKFSLKQCPHGIAKYCPSYEIKKIASKYFNINNLELRKSKNSCIEGLYTIGSTGSLAQTTQSDFDFWVLINEDTFSDAKIKKLKLKLRQIEIWADKEFDTEVNFFLLDIHKALNNDFGILSFESSGSAQARLLKEEFYRTILYIAGKLPLWTVLPVSLSVHYYNNINNLIQKTSLSTKYIDLGDIHGIPSGEYFGASIWHMYKLLKSPFKSVIKMALLEKFIYEYGKEPLLCNKIKDIWINSGNQLKLANCDSYYVLIHELIKYYESIKDFQSVKLIQICFFLKVRITKKSDIENTLFGIREQVINKLVSDWSMDSKKIFEIGNYMNWEYKTIEKLSSTIESYMIDKMRMMNHAFENAFKSEAKITPGERTVLVRNIIVEFSKEKGKIERVLLVSRNNTYFQKLSFQRKEMKNRIIWELMIDHKKNQISKPIPLKSASTIEEVCAWLINNSFYTEKSIINLIPNPTQITHNDIVNFMDEAHNFFYPLMQKEKSFQSLISEAVVIAVFVSVNLCVNRTSSNIEEYSVIYMNSWNEMFVYSKRSKKGFASLEVVIKDIGTKIGVTRFPKKTIFFSPKTFWGIINNWEDLLG